jgi:hypothetical protein
VRTRTEPSISSTMSHFAATLSAFLPRRPRTHSPAWEHNSRVSHTAARTPGLPTRPVRGLPSKCVVMTCWREFGCIRRREPRSQCVRDRSASRTSAEASVRPGSRLVQRDREHRKNDLQHSRSGPLQGGQTTGSGSAGGGGSAGGRVGGICATTRGSTSGTSILNRSRVAAWKPSNARK